MNSTSCRLGPLEDERNLRKGCRDNVHSHIRQAVYNMIFVFPIRGLQKRYQKVISLIAEIYGNWKLWIVFLDKPNFKLDQRWRKWFNLNLQRALGHALISSRGKRWRNFTSLNWQSIITSHRGFQLRLSIIEQGVLIAMPSFSNC